MSFSAVINESMTLDRSAIGFDATVTGDAVIKASESVGPAWSGQLTTRTNNTDGVVTMDDADHAITNGRVDVYWEDGVRVGATAAVSGTAVTLSAAASGDNLPVVNTNVTVCVCVSQPVAVTGNNVQALGVQFGQAVASGVAAFTQSNNAAITYIQCEETGYIWFDGNGITSPLASNTVGRVFLSTSNTDQAVDGFVGILYT